MKEEEKKDYPVGQKGIVEQIHDSVVIPSELPTLEEFKKMIEDASKRARKAAIQREKDYKETVAHIRKREKELGEPAPEMLWLRVGMSLSGPVFMGADEFQSYSKWLK